MLYIIIIIIGILLITLNIRYINEDKHTFENILKVEEERTDRDYDLEIISIRKDLAESLVDIQKEIEELKEKIDNIKEENYNFNNKKENIIDKEVISEINFNNKISNEENIDNKNNKMKNVDLLLDKGSTEDEICNELNIGKGEVLLIKNLLKK